MCFYFNFHTLLHMEIFNMFVITLYGGPLNGKEITIPKKDKTITLKDIKTGQKTHYSKFDSRTYKFIEPRPTFLEQAISPIHET